MARRQSGPPSEVTRPPTSGRSRLSKEQIAVAALGIADAEGFDAVTMRRLARELGAGTMTLYHYMRTKSELISLMDDLLMGEALVDQRQLGGGWKEDVATLARSTRSALLRHPWAVHSLGGAQFGLNAMKHFEQSLAAVSELSTDTVAKLDLLALVDAYVFGSVIQTAEATSRGQAAASDEESVNAAIEWGLTQLRTGSFPNMVALFGSANPRTLGDRPSPIVMDEAGLSAQFERGLQTVLEGASARLGLPAEGGRKT